MALVNAHRVSSIVAQSRRSMYETQFDYVHQFDSGVAISTNFGGRSWIISLPVLTFRGCLIFVLVRKVRPWRRLSGICARRLVSPSLQLRVPALFSFLCEINCFEIEIQIY